MQVDFVFIVTPFELFSSSTMETEDARKHYTTYASLGWSSMNPALRW
jgi:hypothetical protein